MSESDAQQRAALEAVIFAADGPSSASAIRRVLRGWTPSQIAAAVEQINAELASAARPYEIAQVDGGYQFRTRPEFGAAIAAAQPDRKVRLSKAALETLAIIAYRQPVTRTEIEEIRSVDCGAVVRSLLERDLLRMVGRRDAPGRPVLYGTTSVFLQTFGLGSLRDMPPLRDLQVEAAEQGTPAPDAALENVEVDDAPPAGEVAIAAADEDSAADASEAQSASSAG